jgi:prepilin-type N-terminal cleavage/methylation domain-containing protein/prepilin-type processing-associated H-X9-DG protein
MNPKQRVARAFTLLEILVVVGILTILAAILFPVFQRVRERGQISVCASNLHQLGLSIAQYAGDYDGKLPYAPNPVTKKILSRPESIYGEPLDSIILTLPDIRFVLKPYGATFSLFRCPSDQMSNNLLRDNPARKTTKFDQWGSSYDYDEEHGFTGKSLSGYNSPALSALMEDADAFHGAGVNAPALDQSSCNVLYVDGHVKLQFRRETVAAMEEADK